MTMNRYGLAAGALLLAAGSAGTALAQSCGEVAARLTEQYALHAEPPLTTPGADAAEVPAPLQDIEPHPLAASEGVLKPDQSEDGAVVEPPPLGQTMPTTPPADVNPPAAQDSTPAANPETQLKALLSAAQAAASEGDEALCRERLETAQELLRKVTPG